MVCPKCNKSPISFFKFIFSFKFKKLECENCKTNLIYDGKLAIFRLCTAILFGMLLGLILIVLDELYGFSFVALLLSIVVMMVIVGVPAEYFFWTHLRLKEDLGT